jgi:GH18 family chitinase
MSKLVSFILSLCLSVATHAADIIGYLPDYRVNPNTLSQIQYCTDVIYFGSELTENGEIKSPEKVNEHLRAISEECNKHKVRLHFCLGGWGKDKHFPAVTASKEKTDTSLKGLKRIAEAYNIKGVDYDWEYPRTDEEMNNFVKFCRETKRQMPLDFMVTAAFHPAHKLPKALSKELDRVHLMTYDLGGEHSAPSHARQAIQQWRAHGTPNSKICIGAAFYARKLNDRNQVKTYAQLLKETNGQAATQMPINGYFGDNRTIIKEKYKLITEEKIRGIIIWELGQDATGEDSLTKLLDRQLP